MPLETYVLFHGSSCPDGFSAAYAAYRALGEAAEYIPVTHGNPPPNLPEGGTIYALDFSYRRPVIQRLRRRHARVMVIDHHATAIADLDGLGDVLLDPTHSGAVLAWEHFHPGEPVPEVLRYVEDRDLWRFALPSSREVNAAIAAEPQTFARWDNLCIHALATDGAAILRHQATQVERIVSNATEVLVGGIPVPGVNTAVYQSEVCHALLERFPPAPFVATWHIDGRGRRAWSLRSRSGSGGYDVGLLAERLGGGGHPNAAGFVDALPKVDLP